MGNLCLFSTWGQFILFLFLWISGDKLAKIVENYITCGTLGGIFHLFPSTSPLSAYGHTSIRQKYFLVEVRTGIVAQTSVDSHYSRIERSWEQPSTCHIPLNPVHQSNGWIYPTVSGFNVVVLPNPCLSMDRIQRKKVWKNTLTKTYVYIAKGGVIPWVWMFCLGHTHGRCDAMNNGDFLSISGRRELGLWPSYHKTTKQLPHQARC